MICPIKLLISDTDATQRLPKEIQNLVMKYILSNMFLTSQVIQEAGMEDSYRQLYEFS